MHLETYIVAVSGGVDSVVLLDMLANNSLQTVAPSFQLPTSNFKLVVAHFDHGIRSESVGDARFVEGLAKKYDLEFELGHGNLGAGASEEAAREARYTFLRQVCKKYEATGVITAHHQDDSIETAIINVIRGTSWRGLASLGPLSTQFGITVFRPLLDCAKTDLISYAQTHHLQWVEDVTNQNEAYLRNYIRHNLIPRAATANPDFKKKLVNILGKAQRHKIQINHEIKHIFTAEQWCVMDSEVEAPRYSFIMWPDEVAREVVYTVLTQLDPQWHPSRLQILRALHFIKTGRPGKELEVSGGLRLHLKTRTVQFKTV